MADLRASAPFSGLARATFLSCESSSSLSPMLDPESKISAIFRVGLALPLCFGFDWEVTFLTALMLFKAVVRLRGAGWEERGALNDGSVSMPEEINKNKNDLRISCG